MRWLYSVPGNRKWYVVALLMLQIGVSLISVSFALVLRRLVDNATKGDSRHFWYCVIVIVVLAVVQKLCNALVRWLTERGQASIENLFKLRLLNMLMSKDYGRVSAVHSGEWMNRLTNDTVVVANGYISILPSLAGMVVRLVAAGVLLVIFDWKFAAILVPCGLVMIGLTYLFRRVLKRLHKLVQEKDGKVRVFLQERIESLMMVKAYVAEEQTVSAAEATMSEHMAARMKRNWFSNLCSTGFGLAMHGMYLFGACYCAYGILTKTITYGTMTAVLQLIGQIQAPFANLSGFLPRYYAMTASAERLMEVERYADDYDVEALPMAEIQKYYKTDLAEIGIRDVNYTYYASSERVDDTSKDRMPVVLQNISVAVRKGEYVAFTGPSGCGKSTVLRLLMGVYTPDSGERYLLDTDGAEKPLDGRSRRLFAYVPQGNRLMSGTIREVVSFGDDAADTDERVNDALRIACAEEFVGTLTQGIQTMLGEHGTGLSEGQMQRIAIARAIYSGAPVLMFDESTSSLDETTEAKLLGNLRALTDRTVVIVTHRPAALSICDRILRFGEDGVSEVSARV
ncbi:MAG: ABC transporter ATP-binding protein [Lachnospiraceae bacterium]|nr:ABC transporter ATP-binding protein [Lachnospiraceae bacterium]